MNSILFPTVIVDNFLDEPEKYIELTKKCIFKPDPRGMWPGQRTDNLTLIYPEVINRLVAKIMSIFYNFNNKVDFLEYECASYFQKISSMYESGWVHADNEWMITSIIYFCNEGYGTSLYSPKDLENFRGIINSDKKQESYKDPKQLEKYKVFRDENNSQFVKNIAIDSKYNRLIAFESDNYHCADNFINHTNEDRLTLLLFIGKLKSNKFPIQRTKTI